MSTLSSTLKIRVGKVYSLWPLHIREIQAAKPKDKPYGLTDGSGLFLWVTPKGQKYWHFRYRFDDKQPRISLGVFPDVSLPLAREKAAEARALIVRGIDPGQKRKQDPTSPRDTPQVQTAE